MSDPIINKTRMRREKISAAFGHDPHQYFEWMKRHSDEERAEKRRLPISFPLPEQTRLSAK